MAYKAFNFATNRYLLVIAVIFLAFFFSFYFFLAAFIAFRDSIFILFSRSASSLAA